jgi:hypothetical protein
MVITQISKGSAITRPAIETKVPKALLKALLG